MVNFSLFFIKLLDSIKVINYYLNISFLDDNFIDFIYYTFSYRSAFDYFKRTLIYWKFKIEIIIITN